MAFPAVGTTLSTSESSAVTSHTALMPGSISAGDLLIIAIATNGALITAAPTGFTHLSTSSGKLAIYWKTATGSETGTVPFTTGTAAKCPSTVYRITGANNASLVAGTFFLSGASAAPDPPNCNPGTSADYLWMTFMSTAQTGATITTFPSGYTANQLQAAGTGGSSSTQCRIGSAVRTNTASSEDVGVWALSASVSCCAVTVAVPPVVAPVFDQDSYRFRNDDGSETTATWRQAVNTPDTVTLDTPIRLRFAIEETAGGDPPSQSFFPQYRQKPSGGSFGSWVSIFGPSVGAVCMGAASSNVPAGGTSATRQIWPSATGYQIGKLLDGDDVGSDNPVNYLASAKTEWEFVIECDSTTGAADGDTFEFRVVGPSGAVLGAYTNTPSLVVGTGVVEKKPKPLVSGFARQRAARY